MTRKRQDLVEVYPDGEAAAEQAQAVLDNEILPLAVAAHRRLLLDQRTPAGALVNAVKLAYERTLGLPEDVSGREPHELSAQELADAIANLTRIKAERARPVIDGEVVPDVFD